MAGLGKGQVLCFVLRFSRSCSLANPNLFQAMDCLSISGSILQLQHNPSCKPVAKNYAHHDAHISTHMSWFIPISVKDSLTSDETLVCQICLPHACVDDVNK